MLVLKSLRIPLNHLRLGHDAGDAIPSLTTEIRSLGTPGGYVGRGPVLWIEALEVSPFLRATGHPGMKGRARRSAGVMRNGARGANPGLRMEPQREQGLHGGLRLAAGLEGPGAALSLKATFPRVTSHLRTKGRAGRRSIGMMQNGPDAVPQEIFTRDRGVRVRCALQIVSRITRRVLGKRVDVLNDRQITLMLGLRDQQTKNRHQ